MLRVLKLKGIIYKLLVKPRPCFIWRGLLHLFCIFPSIHMCVCFQYVSKNIEPINFIFGGSLPSDPGRRPFDFEKSPWGKGGYGGSKIWP